MDENKNLNDENPVEDMKENETQSDIEAVNIIDDKNVPLDEKEIAFDGPSEDDVPDIEIRVFDDLPDPDTFHEIERTVSEELGSSSQEEMLDTTIEQDRESEDSKAELSFEDVKERMESKDEGKPAEMVVENLESELEGVEFTAKTDDSVNESDDMVLEIEKEEIPEDGKDNETPESEPTPDAESEVVEATVEPEINSEPPQPPIVDPKKKSKAPYIVIGIALVAIVALIAVLVPMLTEDKNNPTPPVESLEPTPSEIVTPAPSIEPTATPTPTPTPTPSSEPEITKIKGEGEIISIGDDTLVIKDGENLVEYFIPEDVDVSQLVAGAKVRFTYIEEESDLVLKEVSITMDQEPVVDEPPEVPQTPPPTLDDIFKDFKDELQIIQGREPNDKNNDNPDSQLPVGEKVETMELPMDVGGSGALWFRFAWAKNDKTTVVPGVNDVIIELQTPSGSIISQENIGKHGRFWIEKNIINFAIKNGKAGQWKFLVTKSESQNLGDISANVLPLSGFITVEKADVNYVGDDLYAIWKITGVKDEEFSIKINAKNANGSDILVYSSSTMDEDIHLVDTVKLSTSKLPAGEYDFVISVEDWDCKTTSGKKQLTGKGMTDSATLTGIVVK